VIIILSVYKYDTFDLFIQPNSPEVKTRPNTAEPNLTRGFISAVYI